jgi:hypothetical protein
MLTLTLIAVGFLVAVALVIALARGSTARWERVKRASVAVRADVPARPTSSAGSAVRVRSSMLRRGVAVLLGEAARLPRAIWRGMGRPRPIRRLGALRSSLFGPKLRTARWRKSRSPDLPVQGDGAGKPHARRPLRATAARAPRRALAFVHRHENHRG